MIVEEAFQIAIPDEVAERLATPRDVVDYIEGRVGMAESHSCLEQRAFYRLRRATIRVFGVSRSAVRPSTHWAELMPARQRRHNWGVLKQAVGVSPWPSLTFWGKVPEPVVTVGGMAEYLARYAIASLQGEDRWTRQQIEETMARLMRDHLGIPRFGWDQQFVKDLGVD